MAAVNIFDELAGNANPDNKFVDPEYPIKEPEPEPQQAEISVFAKLAGVQPLEPEIAPPPEPESFMGNVGDLLSQSGTQFKANLSSYLLTGQWENLDDDSRRGLTEAMAIANEYHDKPEELEQYLEKIGSEAEDVGTAWDAGDYTGAAIQAIDFLGSTIWEGITNPKGFAYMTAEQGANLAATVGSGYATGKLGAVSGGAIGSVVPGAGTAVGAVVGSTGGFLLGATTAGYFIETGAQIREFISAQGGDPTDPRSIYDALNNPELRKKMLDDASKKGLSIATWDAAANLLSIRLLKGAKGPMSTFKRTAGALGAQVGAAATGEIQGQYLATGDVNWRDVGAEVALEMGPGGLAEPVVGAWQARKYQDNPIEDGVRTIEENKDAVTRALNDQATKMARDGVIRDEREMLESEQQAAELAIQREADEIDAREKVYKSAAHAEVKLQQLEKKYGDTRLFPSQNAEGEWILESYGMHDARRKIAERNEQLGVGLRPAEEGQMEVTEIPAETITEPNPTTEGIEVEEITTRGVAAPVEGIEVTELAADEEIEMRRGSIYTGDDQVIPPTAREWHGATQKEVEQEMGAEVWDNGALAQRAVDKIKEHFPDSKVETALIDGEWKIVPPGRASIERVKNARAKDQGLLRPPKKPPDDDDPPPPSGGGAPPPGGAPVAPRSKEDVESELADVKAELEQQPRNQDIDATTDPETIGKVQNLLKRQQELTDERDTGLTGEALTDERSRLRQALTDQRKGMGRKYETITSMREKLGEAETDTTGVVSGETPSEQPQKKQRAKQAEIDYLLEFGMIQNESQADEFIEVAKALGVKIKDGSKFPGNLQALRASLTNTGDADLNKKVQKIYDQVEDKRDFMYILRTEHSDVAQAWDDLLASRAKGPVREMVHTLEKHRATASTLWEGVGTLRGIEFVKALNGDYKGKFGWHVIGDDTLFTDGKYASLSQAKLGYQEWKKTTQGEAEIKRAKEGAKEQEPETPTTTSTDVLPDGTEYDLSHTKDTQVPNTVGTYDKVKDEYFSDVDNGDILDYGAGMGLAAKKHGFESLEPYPTGWEPDYFTADEIDRQYDGIIMNNVLNVLPKHTRHVVLADAAKRKLSPGGRMYINVRSRGDVMGQKETAKKVFSESEILTQRNTYQKGFQRAELIKYLERELGDGYTVESAKFGSIGVLVTKAAGPSTTAEGGTLEARLDALPVNKEYAAKLKAELDEKNRVAQLQSQKKQTGWEQPIEDEFEYTPLDETNPQFQQLSDEGKDEVRRIKREMAYYHQKDPKHEELMLLQYELQRLVERELGKPEPTKTGIWALDQDTEKYPPAFSLYGKKLPAATRAYGAEYMERTKQHPLMDDVRILMNPQQKNPEDFALLEIEAFGSDGGVLVKTIQSSRAGKGNGNAGVNFLLDLANEHGVDLMLDPQAYGELEGRLNQKQLEGWYKRKGFEPMPDYEGMMIYRPLVKAEPETVSDLRAEEREESLRTMTETTQPKTLKELREHPLVDEIVDERSEDNGYWVYLKPGWRSPSTDTGSIHEMTVKELLKDFAGIYQTKEEAPAPTGPVEKKGNRLYINGKAATKWDVLILMERDYANHPAEHLRAYESVMTVDEVLEFFNRRYLASLEPTQTETTDTEAQQVMDKYAKTRPELAGAIMSHKPGDDRKGNTLVHYYGEFLMTEDKDGMPVDLVLNQEHDPKTNTPIYIVNAATEKGAFEQHKVMLGFKDEKDAQEGFDENWPGRPVKSVERITPEAFQEWKVSGDTKREYNREQWTGRMNKNVPLDRPAPADNVLTPEELAAFPASAITSVSPWILADGSVVETGTDHVGYAAERGIISRKKDVSQVANFQQKAKAVRAAFSSDTSEAVTFAWLHLHDKQKLNDAQIDTLERFFEETEKLGKKPAVIIGRSPDGNNPKTTRINSIEDLRAWNDGKELSEFSLTSPPGTVKEPTPEYGDTTDDLLRDAGRGDLAWGPVPESTPLTPEELAERPQQEGPAAPVDWEPVPELERPPIVDIGGVLDASAEATEGTATFQVISGNEVTIDGKTFSKDKYDAVLVTIKTDALERLLTSEMVGPAPGYKSQISNRIEQFKRFWDKNDSITTGSLAVNEKGYVSFSNGRHRTRVMIEKGMTEIPVSMSKESLAALEKITKPKALSDIPLTAEDGDTRITHNAKWWKDAIDERLTNLNKLRGCA